MNCVSGGASKNLLPNKKLFCLLSTSCLDRFMLVLMMWYFAIANYISVENYDMNIKFIQTNGPVAQFFRPGLRGTCWIPIHDIITKVDPPSYEGTC